jgi:tripartite-type tricarboxylate transporter receptor subunit TctC
VAAPARTPKERVTRLNREIANILASSGLKARLETSGLEPKGNSPQEMALLVKSDYERWGKVVRASGIKVE